MLNKTAVAFVVLVAVILSAGPVSANLIAHWTFDGNANDSAGSVNGTLFGSPSFTVVDGGKIGQALIFDGSNDYVRLTGGPWLNDYNGSFSAWVYRDTTSTTGPRLMHKTGTGTVSDQAWNNVMTLNISSGGIYDGRFQLTFYNQGKNLIDNTPAGVFSTGIWTHLAVTSSGDTTQIYVNGVQQTLSGTDNGLTGAMWFGDINGTTTETLLGARRLFSDGTVDQFFDGMMDDAALTDSALTAAQVKAIYDLGKSVTYNYDIGEVHQLFGTFAAGQQVIIGDTTWEYKTSGLGSTLGLSGDEQKLVMNSTAGSGFEVVPEPATLGFLAIGGFGMIGAAIRRRRAA